MSELRKRGLGRGFDSLIPTQMDEQLDVAATTSADGRRVLDSVLEVDPALVDPNPHQPRQNFDPEALEALAASIRVHGILQPLVVTRSGSRYELIAGERRLRSAKLAGLSVVPVIVRSFDEQQKLELAIIENIQRAELNPLEMAAAYRKLNAQFNLTMTEIGERVGKDVSTIANSIRLLNLPDEAKKALLDGVISVGHSIILLSITEPDKQLELLGLIIKNNWTVRQAGEFVKGFKGRAGNKQKAEERLAAVSQLTMELGDFLGTKVTQQTMKRGGRIVIEYYSQEELDRIYRTIRRED